jgi:hypothetical protein
VSKEKWKMTSEFKDAGRAELIFDGEPNSAWILRNPSPVDFEIDLGEKLNLTGFTYSSRSGTLESGSYI